MLAATYNIRPGEIRRWNLDCKGWLDEGVTVLTGDVTVEPGTDPELFIPTTFVQEGRRLVYTTGGGKDGETYNATLRVTLSDGQVRTTCVRYNVRTTCGVQVL